MVLTSHTALQLTSHKTVRTIMEYTYVPARSLLSRCLVNLSWFRDAWPI
jgi:hypothetical protein